MHKHKLLNTFKRNRTYARHERFGVVAGLLALTLIAFGANALMTSGGRAEAANVEVQSVTPPDRAIVADGQDNEAAQISLTQLGSVVPAVNTWVGLKPKSAKAVSPKYIYKDWYSPLPARAFFKTDARGEVSFPMMSDKAGKVAYDIYLANIVDDEVVDYQKLDGQVEVEFVAP